MKILLMKTNLRAGLICAISMLLLTACSPKSNYDWGSYDSTVKEMYVANSDFKIDSAIEELGKEIEKSQPQKIPPGKAALLGYLYASRGDMEPAKKYFQLEAQLFPEAKTFVDGLLLKEQKK